MILTEAQNICFSTVADKLRHTQEPWWILGSGALALLGIDPGGIEDIDILVSEADARLLSARYDLENRADGGTERYRSSVFLQADWGGMRVELMSGYEVFSGSDWRPVKPTTRYLVRCADATLYVPEVSEQIDLLTRLGRPKDLARLKALHRWMDECAADTAEKAK